MVGLIYFLWTFRGSQLKSFLQSFFFLTLILLPGSIWLLVWDGAWFCFSKLKKESMSMLTPSQISLTGESRGSKTSLKRRSCCRKSYSTLTERNRNREKDLSLTLGHGKFMGNFIHSLPILLHCSLEVEMKQGQNPIAPLSAGRQMAKPKIFITK